MEIEKELYELYKELRCKKYEMNQVYYDSIQEGNEDFAKWCLGKIDCLSYCAGRIERILREHDVPLFPQGNILQRIWFRLTHIGW